MSKNKKDDELTDSEYEKALIIAEMIKRNVEDIIAVVSANSSTGDIYSSLAAYSSLLAVANYMEFKLTEENISQQLLESTKVNAENYALDLISQEKNVGVQKKGDA